MFILFSFLARDKKKEKNVGGKNTVSEKKKNRIENVQEEPSTPDEVSFLLSTSRITHTFFFHHISFCPSIPHAHTISKDFSFILPSRDLPSYITIT